MKKKFEHLTKTSYQEDEPSWLNNLDLSWELVGMFKFTDNLGFKKVRYFFKREISVKDISKNVYPHILSDVL